jgi:hypothetical protein
MRNSDTFMTCSASLRAGFAVVAVPAQAVKTTTIKG